MECAGKRFGLRYPFQGAHRFYARYEVHTIGAAHHSEWWIPAQELDELNDNIVGLIEVIREFTT